jgi:hypothetical protein
MPRLNQWMGDLFVLKKLPPTEIKSLDYKELEYWHKWCDAEIEAKRKAHENARNR